MISSWSEAFPLYKDRLHWTTYEGLHGFVTSTSWFMNWFLAVISPQLRMWQVSIWCGTSRPAITVSGAASLQKNTKKRCNESQQVRRFWAQKPGSISQEERSQCHPQPHGMRQLQPMRLVSVVTMKWVTGNATIGTSWPGLQDYDLSEWGSLPFLLLPSYASEKVASISHRNCLISFDQCKGQAVMAFHGIFLLTEGTPRPQPRGVSKYPCFRIRHCLARSSPAWWLHKATMTSQRLLEMLKFGRDPLQLDTVAYLEIWNTLYNVYKDMYIKVCIYKHVYTVCIYIYGIWTDAIWCLMMPSDSGTWTNIPKHVIHLHLPQRLFARPPCHSHWHQGQNRPRCFFGTEAVHSRS